MKPGDFAVVDRRWHRVVVEVTSVTAAQFKAKGEHSSREKTYTLASAMFAGPEHIANALCAALDASSKQYDEENFQAKERLAKRNADLIASAKASAER